MTLVQTAQSAEASWLDQRSPLAIAFPFLALATPFTVYLTNRDYPLMTLEVWTILVGMFGVSAAIGLVRHAGGRRMYAICVSSLLTVAVDHLGFVEWVAQGSVIALLVIFGVLLALLRRFEKTTTLAVSAFLAVFIIASVVDNRFETESAPTLAVQRKDAKAGSLPRFIHIILDEHLGIEGIPDDTEYARALKDKIKEFYQRYGFKLYGGAYSHYFETVDSIPNLVNFSAEDVYQILVTSDPPPHRLHKNRYFEFMKTMGYRIHVMDGDFLDFCSTPDARPEFCTKYRWAALSNVAKLDDPVLTKTATALAVFVASYPRYQGILDFYEQRVRPFLLLRGMAAPVINHDSLWTRRRLQPFSVNTMAAMDTLSGSIQQLNPGDMLFAHLLLPHFPYLYREDCSQRTLPESMDNMEKVPLELRTPEVRKVRFDQYLRQVECLYVRLDELFQKLHSFGIFGDSIVIVNGDHGARLGLHHPIAKEVDHLTPADYADGLSTLFAVKIPGRTGGYDSSLHAIDELLVQTLGAVGQAPSLMVPRHEPFAYLRVGGQRDQLLVEMPWRPSN